MAMLRSYQQYYNGTRTHLSLAKDCAPTPSHPDASAAFFRCRSSAAYTTITSGSN